MKKINMIDSKIDFFICHFKKKMKLNDYKLLSKYLTSCDMHCDKKNYHLP